MPKTITIKLIKDDTRILPYHVALYYDNFCITVKVCKDLDEAQRIIMNYYTQEILALSLDNDKDPHVRTTITA